VHLKMSKRKRAQQVEGLHQHLAQLRSNSPKTQAAAARGLAAQAAEPDGAAVIIDAPGAVSGLVLLLLGGAACVVEPAAAAVEALAQHADDSHLAIMVNEPGLVQALTQVMCSSSSSSTPVAQTRAASAISLLAKVLAARQVLGQQPGLVASLVALLSSSSRRVRWNTACVLALLALDEGLALRIVQEPEAIARLLALLRGSTRKVQEAAAVAFSALLQHAACRHACAEHMADLAAALVLVLQSSSCCCRWCLVAPKYAARAIS
jgi:hypothetical protein